MCNSTPRTRAAKRELIAAKAEARAAKPSFRLNPAGIAAVAVSAAWFLVSVVEGLPL